jgi:hypothetical protein
VLQVFGTRYQTLLSTCSATIVPMAGLLGSENVVLLQDLVG